MGSPIQTPTGIAPRSSTTGIAEIVAKTAHFGSPKLVKKLATFCPVCKCSTVSLATFLAAKAGLAHSVRVTRASAVRLRSVVNAVFASTLRLELLSWIESLLRRKGLPVDSDDSDKFSLVIDGGGNLGNTDVRVYAPVVDCLGVTCGIVCTRTGEGFGRMHEF